MYALAILIIGFLAPIAAHAQYHLVDSGWNCQGFLYCNGGAPPANIVVVITMNIITGVSTFIGALAIVVFLYGAIRMVTSQGQEGKEAGKKALVWASFGLTAAILTGGIMAYIRSAVFAIS